MDIITEYPIWLAFFCILLGALLSFVLYYKDRNLSEFSKTWIGILFTLRFVLLSMLLFFLLGPLIRTYFSHTEKPIVIFAQDNSESIKMGREWEDYSNTYKSEIESILSEMSSDFEVKSYSFGESLESGLDFEYSEVQTNLSSLFKELNVLYSNRNVGALILATDGIYNKGMNPVYLKEFGQLNFPIYGIGLGDTARKKDVKIIEVGHNKLAYLGNEFPLEILLESVGYKGQKSALRIYQGKKLLYEQKIQFKEQVFIRTIPIYLTAQKKGIQHYKIQIEALEDEMTLENNSMDIFVDVIDSKKKILLLANSPHPDISALQATLKSNENYDVELLLESAVTHPLFTNPNVLEKYNLLIAHQIPSFNKKGANILKKAFELSIPILLVIGNKTDIDVFNTLPIGLVISEEGGMKSNKVQPIYNENFDLFTLNKEWSNSFSNFPPLLTPFGNYQMKLGVNVLFNQKIGNVATEKPLVLIHNSNDGKLAVITGEGIWRWRLHNQLLYGNKDHFDDLISKIAQFLSLKEEKSRFRVYSNNNFLVNEEIKFEAEVYNQTYELINEPEVNMVITNEEGKQFTYSFSRVGKSYNLGAGQFLPGTYSYKSIVQLGNEVFEESGQFSVSPIQVETIQTIANHQLLSNLVNKRGGEVVSMDSIFSIPNKIKNRSDVKTIVSYEERLSDLIQLKWIFFLFLSMVSLEWFVRKRNGAY